MGNDFSKLFIFDPWESILKTGRSKIAARRIAAPQINQDYWARPLADVSFFQSRQAERSFVTVALTGDGF
jgi:hypothetical protein